MLKKALDVTVVAVLLNVVLSKLLSMFATAEEHKPKDGPTSLSLKGQFMHMMVHHEQVLFMSSFIVGLVVFLSVVLSHYLKPVSTFL